MKRNSYKTHRGEPPTLLAALDDDSHRACSVKPFLMIGGRCSSRIFRADAFDSPGRAGQSGSGIREPFHMIGRRRLPE
ncbi:hypothetical protein ACFL6A_04735 [bacterium]